MKKLIGSGIAALSMLAGSAMASEIVNSAATNYKYGNGSLLIDVWDAPGNKPACATSEQWDYRVDITQQNIALLRLFVANPTAERAFKGNGSCTGNVENLQFVGSTVEPSPEP